MRCHLRKALYPACDLAVQKTDSKKTTCVYCVGLLQVAKLKTTKLLRPQSLPIKMLGVGSQCLAANIPCGAAREHTEKFSVAWFLAVHATVPFFAFMRKGVGMPKWGIALTLAAAVAGQTIGAKLEQARYGLLPLQPVCLWNPSCESDFWHSKALGWTGRAGRHQV